DHGVLQFTPDSRAVLLVDRAWRKKDVELEMRVTTWDVATGAARVPIAYPSRVDKYDQEVGYARSALSANGKTLATWAVPFKDFEAKREPVAPRVKVFDVDSGEPLCSIEYRDPPDSITSPPFPIQAVAVSPNGRVLATGSCVTGTEWI